MKISLNWLKEYVDIKIPDDELIRLIGLRLVEVEGVIDETHKYDNIYVVRVEKAEKIPDTHLTLCQINTGKPELVQVVCGAPNVREGMLAVWLAPGATVPVSVHEDAPFIIGKRKMLGKYDSEGMLAGADELDFDDKHEKIAEINPEIAKPGDLLSDVFDLKDYILEIENKSLTHRPDCFGIIGFAREIAGILGQSFKEPELLTHESVFPEGFFKSVADGVVSQDENLEIELSDQTLCPRYSAAVIRASEPTVKEKYLSKMQVQIAKSGTFTHSKIVDVTNYLMYLTGQPLHAFDFNKFVAIGKSDKPKIIVRAAKTGEKLTLLDGKQIECIESDIVITSNDVPVAMAGAMGGITTAIDEETKNVLIESASFSLYNLRKTQMAHGIFSEAITRFTKGVPVGGTFNVLAGSIKEIGGKPISARDCYPQPIVPSVVKITTEEINQLLGTNYSKELIIKTLQNVSFEVKESGNNLEITPGYWRTDIHIKEDIIEEIGRLLGYDNITPTLPLHQTASKNQMFELKSALRNLLSKYGANEVLTYSFISERLLNKVGQDTKNSYRITNSISPELQYVRQSLIPNLLEKSFLNEKLPVNQFAIFEINKLYRKEWGLTSEDVPVEQTWLAFTIADRKYNNKTAFYQAKKYVDKIFKDNNITATYLPLKEDRPETKPFEKKRSAAIYINEEYVGVVGEFKKSVRSDFKLADYLAGFEINLDLLLKNASTKKRIEFTKTNSEDVTITSEKNYAEVLAELEKEYENTEILPVSIYQADNQSSKNYTFHIIHKL
ncbi:phenylalanine--tRNA ligase subunit beta [Candidatus Saccharibacteria bacterium]|nr:phenylalanine--tRNA ligase subunit beta [Candidatus Saccharibacteria bacterium]